MPAPIDTVQVTRALPSFRRSLLALVLGAMGIGFAPIFVRVSEVGPTATAFWRLLLALPFLLVWTAFSPQTRTRSGPFPWFLILAVGAFFAGDLAVWHASVRLTSVANATLETNFSAIFVPLFLWMAFRQKITTRFFLALLIAIGGTILLVGQNAHISPLTFRGDALGIGSAVFYSGYLLSVKTVRERGLPTAVLMILSGLVASAFLFLIALFLHETLLPVTPQGWLTLISLALVAQIGGQTLIAYALFRLPASFASLVLLVQPATSALAAWLLLGETLSPAQFAGAVILAAGLWLARREAA
jgi:drug/metabolite transporter (DMT)-like permease